MIKAWLNAHSKKQAWTDETKQRHGLGTLASQVGLASNLLLFLLKFLAGLAIHSLAVVGDALNNLTDSSSSLLLMLSFHVANKPPDREHPFGHARIEYFLSGMVALLILYAGGSLAFASVKKFFVPEPTQFHWTTLALMLFSVALKLFLRLFYQEIDRRIDSEIIRAAIQDSMGDVWASTAILLSFPLSAWLKVPLDPFFGLVVSGFILKAGVEVMRTSLDKTMGQAADKDLVDALYAILEADETVLGYHELMIHDYGAQRRYASIDVEVDAKAELPALHEAMDRLEQRCWHKLGVHLTIHVEPLGDDSPALERYREDLEALCQQLEPEAQITDLRMLPRSQGVHLIFDLHLPYARKEAEVSAARRQWEEALSTPEERVRIHLRIQRDFVGER